MSDVSSSAPGWSARPAPTTPPARDSTWRSSTGGRWPGGTTGAGEGNLLVSDKEPGPELDLALLSNRLWRELAASPVGGVRVRGQGRPRRRRDRPTSGAARRRWPPSSGDRSTRPSPARRACATSSPTWPTASPAASSTRRTPRSSPCWPPPACSGTAPVAVRPSPGCVRTGRDRHRSPSAPASGSAGVRTDQGDLPGRRRRQRRGHLGRRVAALAGVHAAGPAPARLHPGHRAAAGR